MKKTAPDVTTVTSGYSGTVRAAFRHRKPVWAVAAFDVAAVLMAIGLIHTINGMIFNTSRGEATGGPPGRSARAAGAENPSTMLPALAAARVGAAMPDDVVAAIADDRVLFAAPLMAEARFGPVVNAPAEGGFAPVAVTGGRTPGSAGAAGPSTVAEAGTPMENGATLPSPGVEEPLVPMPVADDAPALLTYVPTPRPVAEAVAIAVTRPLPKVIGPADDIVETAIVPVVESAISAPLSLAPRIAATAGAGAQSQPEVNAPAVAASSDPVGNTGPAAAGSAVQLVGNTVTTTASSTVQTGGNIATAATAPVKAVIGLLN